VDDMVGDLVTLASVLDYNSSMLAHRVDKFTNISNAFIGTTQKNITELQGYIFDQQAQVTRAMASLGSLMDYSEKDVQLRQQQFNNWIDGLIANETQVIADKTAALKASLLGTAGTTATTTTAATTTSVATTTEAPATTTAATTTPPTDATTTVTTTTTTPTSDATTTVTTTTTTPSSDATTTTTTTPTSDAPTTTPAEEEATPSGSLMYLRRNLRKHNAIQTE